MNQRQQRMVDDFYSMRTLERVSREVDTKIDGMTLDELSNAIRKSGCKTVAQYHKMLVNRRLKELTKDLMKQVRR